MIFYGHITLKIPLLVRSPKLGNVEPSQYLNRSPPGNTGCCRHFLKFLLYYFTHNCPPPTSTLATPDNQHLLRSRFARLTPRAQFPITKLSEPAPPPLLYHRHRQVGNSTAFINTRPMLLGYSYIIVLLVTAAQHRKVGLRE